MIIAAVVGGGVSALAGVVRLSLVLGFLRHVYDKGKTQDVTECARALRIATKLLNWGKTPELPAPDAETSDAAKDEDDGNHEDTGDGGDKQ